MGTYVFTSKSKYSSSETKYTVNVYENSIFSEIDHIQSSQSEFLTRYPSLAYISSPWVQSSEYSFSGQIDPFSAISISFGRDLSNNLGIIIKDTLGNSFNGKYGPGMGSSSDGVYEVPPFWPLMIKDICQVVYPNIILKMLGQLERNYTFEIGPVTIEYTGIRYEKKLLWNKYTELVKWRNISFQHSNGFLVGSANNIALFKLDCTTDPNAVVLPDFVEFMTNQVL